MYIVGPRGPEVYTPSFATALYKMGPRKATVYTFMVLEPDLSSPLFDSLIVQSGPSRAHFVHFLGFLVRPVHIMQISGKMYRVGPWEYCVARIEQPQCRRPHCANWARQGPIYMLLWWYEAARLIVNKY